MATSEEHLTERDLDVFEDFYTHGKLTNQQLAALHCELEVQERRIRDRTFKLSQAQFIKSLETPVDHSNQFVLAQRGMNALSNARSFAPKRISIPRNTQQSRTHDTALSDFTVTVDLLVRSLGGAKLIDELSLINRSPRLDVRAHRGWPVSVYHADASIEHWVKPDRFLAIEFQHRPDNRNRRYFAIELDRGTMPLEAKTLHKASIIRKLLAYQATHTNGVLQEHFAIPFAYTLYLTIGRRRRDNMAALAKKTITDDRAARAQLFAVQPPAPTIEGHADLRKLEWINGRGERTELPL